MGDAEARIDHEAIRTGAIPWSADELDYVLQESDGAEEALHIAAARARELGLDTGTAMAHGMRLFAILDFLHDHHHRLYECGLLLPRDTEKDLISDQLLDVLATFPFTAPTGEKSAGGKDHLGFDAYDVIIEAGRRQKVEDATSMLDS
jgi:hypothetical protein